MIRNHVDLSASSSQTVASHLAETSLSAIGTKQTSVPMRGGGGGNEELRRKKRLRARFLSYPAGRGASGDLASGPGILDWFGHS